MIQILTRLKNYGKLLQLIVVSSIIFRLFIAHPNCIFCILAGGFSGLAGSGLVYAVMTFFNNLFSGALLVCGGCLAMLLLLLLLLILLLILRKKLKTANVLETKNVQETKNVRGAKASTSDK